MRRQTDNRLAGAQRDRDAALTRVSRVRRMTIIGAGALTAAIAAVVSAVAPGRSLGAKVPAVASTHARTAAVAPRSSAAARMPPLASPSSLGLGGDGSSAAPQPQATQPAPSVQAQPQPAPVAPQPAPSTGGGVVSGGS